MHFEDVIDNLEKMVGMELEAIVGTKGANPPITILSVDRENRRYIVDKTEFTNRRTRPFSELQKVWDVLSTKGFANVDQAINGAGSSRHQPETVIANLPFVEHFKYEKKKHLYLKPEKTHALGTLKELSVSESRELKKRIDNYRDFDISFFHAEHSRTTNALKDKLKVIAQKYPGESDVDAVEQLLQQLDELQEKLAVSIVSLDSPDIVDDEHSISGRNYEEDDTDEDYQEFFGKHEEDDSSKYLVATRISQVFPTVSLLYDRINHGEIDLQPEFQRKDRIWPLRDKARLIESILLGLPIPVFYFAENSSVFNEDVDWIVIDGLQRTTTIYDFMAGRFELKYLDRRVDLNGLLFKDLPRREQRRIREYQIQGHLIQVSSESDEMVRELFQRINTSGKNLSYQEIRSALYPGTANKFLKFMADTPEFLNSTPMNINPERMLDLEYVLRAVSYIYLGYKDFHYSKYDDFLCQTLRELNRFDLIIDGSDLASKGIYSDICSRLKKSFTTINVVFGKEAFRKEPTGRLNKPLFELLVSVFALVTDEQRQIIERPNIAHAIKDELFKIIASDSEKYAEWSSSVFEMQNRGFDYSISNSTGKAVTIKYRFDSFINMINQVAGINFKFKPIKRIENDQEY
ncbi:hypothetical protein SN11_25135 [Vibrio harveyi]|nr:hypothetical protein SN11_25135 [Vibrio harveyi]